MKGFLLDLNLCTGCQACMLACAIENRLQEPAAWRRVYNSNPHRRPGVPVYHLSIGCLHCAEPACMQACPSAAYSRNPITGAVLVDSRRCVGCRLCHWACPFDAPHYDKDTGTVSKCTFCNDRLLADAEPACTASCPTGALQFAELDSASPNPLLDGLPSTTLGPSARFVPPRSSRGPELSSITLPRVDPSDLLIEEEAPEPKVSIESDWSLIFFSVAAALLVAIAADSIAGSALSHGWDFLFAALGTIAVSLFHLGKRRSAWRAVLHAGRSWLSREVLFFSLFVAFGTWMLFSPALSSLLAFPTILCGYISLLSMDRLYESVSGGLWTRLHSARVLLTSLFLFGILSSSLWIAGGAGMLKLVLYAYRQTWFKSRRRALVSALRMALGFVLPIAFWNNFPQWILPVALIAEVIDRCEYYLDLEVAGITHSLQS
jgi:Fe-S-cluster-containing dehydrogenase component